MSDEVDHPQLQNAWIWNQYDTLDGFLIVQLGVTMTATYEPNGERALAAVADSKDKFLVPCVRVRKKR